MAALLAGQGRIRVVQIGANDGVINDPLHSFLMEHRDKTDVLLIEPQPYLIPFLARNYEGHPTHRIANFAVGESGVLMLHTVEEQHWADCQPPYALGWPAYRAPTGISSGDRDIVLEWLRHYYKGPAAIEDIVVTFSTECLPLIDLMERVGWTPTVDVLQVDCEGLDDEVLYQSSLETLMPALINFEESELSTDRFSKLARTLTNLGYVLQSTGADTLAIRVYPPPAGELATG